jgi:hypothetical protein
VFEGGLSVGSEVIGFVLSVLPNWSNDDLP